MRDSQDQTIPIHKDIGNPKDIIAYLIKSAFPGESTVEYFLPSEREIKAYQIRH